jgi:ketosteroid isomerase-like protein
MSFEGTIADRQLIRERIDAYADAAFRKDREAWLANWCEDCVWKVFGSEVRGKDAMREQWTGIWTIFEHMAFFTQLGSIEVDGDRAKVRSYCREILRRKDGGISKIIGAYDDEMVREGGAWLFARRDYQVLMDESKTEGP